MYMMKDKQRMRRNRRKRDELIPFEKSERVIYLDRRGLKRTHMPVGSMLLMILGILCLLYCVGIGLFMGYGTKFFLVWGAIGAALAGLGWLTANDAFMEWLPFWVKVVCAGVAALAVVLFVVVECFIVSRFTASPPAGADYCIVLGAQLKDHGPSDVLRRRLDAAAQYLKQNPDTKCIVSGGQGRNEPMSEARGMYEYLIAAGIEEERIVQEDRSSNTYYNLAYSEELLDRKEDTVVIVTNNFHVFRAVGIAQKMGYEQVYGLAASSYPGMLPNNMLREFLGVVKDFLVGNL